MSYINADDVALVYSMILRIQQEKPYQGVSKIEVEGRFNDKKKWYSRKIGRAFKNLSESKRIIKRKWGEYWIPEFLGKHIEYLKSEVRLQDYEKKFVELLIQAYDKEIDRLYSKLEDQEHRYEQYIQDFENEIAERELKSKSLFKKISNLCYYSKISLWHPTESSIK